MDAKLRWPERKAAFVISAVDTISDARNIMVDVYHEDFPDSIAIDSRNESLSTSWGAVSRVPRCPNGSLSRTGGPSRVAWLDVCEMIREVTRPGTALGDLVDVHDVRQVVLRDVWSGMSPHSPIAAEYELHRGASGALAGEGRLSTGLVAPKAFRVSMKAATASAFLDALARAWLTRGDYQPFMDHTDDFPRIEIVLHGGAGGDARGGFARLYTESQGRFHTPWAASVAGASYTIEGDEIGRALRALDRTLKRAELRRMTQS